MAVTAYPVWPLRRRHDALLDIVENQIARQEGGIAVKDVLYHVAEGVELLHSGDIH